MGDSPTRQGLFRFGPPYHSYEPIQLGWKPEEPDPGGAAVWFMVARGDVWAELDWAQRRPPHCPLFVVLPEPDEIVPLAAILRSLPDLAPRGVIPMAGRGLESALTTLLAAPPRALPRAVADQLIHTGLRFDPDARDVIETVFGSAPHVRSIQQLASRMCQSRRTLGRFFSDRGLPVPSHWLQFARVLHVAIQLQNTKASISRVSTRFGYKDGFTMSNSMKRLTGYRPSFVREHLGWEWLVAAWLRQELG